MPPIVTSSTLSTDNKSHLMQQAVRRRLDRALPLIDTLVTATPIRTPRVCYAWQWLQARGIASTTPFHQEAIPLRKHLKEELRRKKVETKKKIADGNSNGQTDKRLEKWELTVGIEVHALLNTASKLFSNAPVLDSDTNTSANEHVALFDAAMPGSQPIFQTATLLPALRAALALGCTIQHESSWDRKHYFHWDQPNGYQITQYYQPFAKDGVISLTVEDGVPLSDLYGGNTSIEVGIKQVQMEQDTAKTTLQPASSVYHVDLNRAGHALIEIITLPHIHSPQTAAAVVRKIQAILKSVDACATGMELGGLRADVNVSVRERGVDGGFGYSGVSGLGQRTEIKNLSSFKAVEDAIVAERDRQISILEAGGVIEGETRGWTLRSTETTRLRGKEGEVDYRYIPDADLAPLLISSDLVEYLRSTLPELPNETVQRVQSTYGLTVKDAKTITSLDDGERLEFMETVTGLLNDKHTENKEVVAKTGKLVGNWVLHELGGMLTVRECTWKQSSILPNELADILDNLKAKRITARSAKQLLSTMVDHTSDPRPSIEQLIEEGNLRLRPLSDEEYTSLAQSILSDNPDVISAIRDKGQRGKIMWFVGQMVRKADEGTVEPERARQVVESLLGV